MACSSFSRSRNGSPLTPHEKNTFLWRKTHLQNTLFSLLQGVIPANRLGNVNTLAECAEEVIIVWIFKVAMPIIDVSQVKIAYIKEIGAEKR